MAISTWNQNTHLVSRIHGLSSDCLSFAVLLDDSFSDCAGITCTSSLWLIHWAHTEELNDRQIPHPTIALPTKKW